MDMFYICSALGCRKPLKNIFFFFVPVKAFLNELLREQLAVLIFPTQLIYFSILVT